MIPLFDLDGVLVDTHSLHYDALKQALWEMHFLHEGEVAADHGFLYTDTRPTRVKVAEALQSWKDTGTWEGDIASTVEEIYARKREIVDHSRLPCMTAGVIELLAYIKQGLDLPLVVVTNTHTSFAKRVFAENGLGTYVDLIVGNDTVQNPKPHHEPYTTAVKMLKIMRDTISHGDCFAVEDSDVGAASASSAGLPVLRINRNQLPIEMIRTLAQSRRTQCS